MTTKLYLDDEVFITAESDGMLRVESGGVIIEFNQEHAKKITKFLNFIYGEGKNDNTR